MKGVRRKLNSHFVSAVVNQICFFGLQKNDFPDNFTPNEWEKHLKREMFDETMFMFILALFEAQMMQDNDDSDYKTFYLANTLPVCSLLVSLELSTVFEFPIVCMSSNEVKEKT